MKFSHKIMLSPLVTAMAFVVIFAVTNRAAQDSSRTIVLIQDETLHAAELSRKLQLELLSLRQLLIEAAVTGKVELLPETTAIASRFHATLDSCQGVPGLDQMIEPLRTEFDSYFGQARSSAEWMVRQGAASGVANSEESQALIEQNSRSYAALSGDIEAVVSRQNIELERAISDLRARLHRLRQVMNLASIVFLALLALLSTVVINSIVRPVQRMNRMARAISSGDLGQELDYHSSDAIGELAESIREMQRSLLQDIAHREQAEADLIATQGQMIQTEKMAVLGKLVAGLSHELNSPLGTMSAAVDVLARSHEIMATGCAQGAGSVQAAPPERMARAAQAMERGLASLNQATARIEELIQGLNVFSQLDKGVVQQTDINEGLAATLTLLDHDIPDGLAVERQFGELEPVLGYPAQLHQVFIVLLRRAVRDTRPKGRVTIGTEQSGDRIRVTISDTGCGYAPAALDAMFNPGFRADTGRMQMDWEMASSRRIIERHQGVLLAESELGRGTRYVLEIPLWPDLQDSAVS